MTQQEATAFDGLGVAGSKKTAGQQKRAETSKTKGGTRLDTVIAGTASRNKVIEAVAILYESEQAITRARVAEISGMSFYCVDDQLDKLLAQGKLRRVVAGVYEPVLQFPVARAITHTMLPDGMSKTEIGDDMLTLTPKERRMLGRMLMSDAASHETIQATHDFNALVSEMTTCMLMLRRGFKTFEEIGRQLGIAPNPLTKGLDDKLQAIAERLIDGTYSQSV